MRCAALESQFDAVADGTAELSPADAAHESGCPRCSRRLEDARTLERLLAQRPADVPPVSFTTSVMLRVGQERWKAERAIDLGFNLAMLAGVLVIASGAAGLLWSLGLLHVSIDLESVWRIVGSDMTRRVLSQVQTVAMSAALLTMALALWWWAEAASD